jgi:23S rRNA (guanosine2251-2'-O)-methyltransferase
LALGRRSNKHQGRANRHSQGERFIEREKPDLDTLLASNKNPFFLVLDGVQDPHNLGACLRTADGAGVDAVIAPQNRAVGITETVSRISCGASESVPFLQVTNIARTLVKLQEHNILVVGTADGAKAVSLYDIDFNRGVAIVMGAEGKGLRRLTMETCDQVVKIPMLGQVDCLNVSVATGVCLYEALRQRQGTS